MNKQKLTYLSPETETLVVRFEGVICTSIPMAALMPNGIFSSPVEQGLLDEDYD